MKKYYFKIAICVFLFSCKKNTDTTISPTLKLLQNDWTYISSRIILPNGNSYLLLKNYKVFRNDGMAITKTNGIVAGQIFLDSSIYKLTFDEKSIMFYQTQNGNTSVVADTAEISKLTDNLLVYSFKRNGITNFIDSLKR